MRKEYKSQLTRSDSVNVILIPLVTAILLGYVIEISRGILILFGKEYIQVSSGQPTYNFGVFTVESFIFEALLPAFIEEFIFMFLSYSGVKIIINKVVYALEDNIINFRQKKQTYIKKRLIIFENFILKGMKGFYTSFYMKNNKAITIIWVFVTATIFSFAHMSSTTSFYMYFVSGAVYSIIFFKYGLLGGITAHAFHNYFAVVTHELAITTLKYLIN